MGPDAYSAIPVLKENLKSDFWINRQTAAEAIWQITRPDAKEAIVVLTALCKEKDAMARCGPLTP